MKNRCEKITNVTNQQEKDIRHAFRSKKTIEKGYGNFGWAPSMMGTALGKLFMHGNADVKTLRIQLIPNKNRFRVVGNYPVTSDGYNQIMQDIEYYLES